jgi:hypothetical protein
MITIKVEGLEQVKQQLAGLSRDMKSKVLQPAINKVAEKARAEINRAIPEEFAVKASEVRNAVEVRKASSGQLAATITIFGSKNKKGRSLNMIHFVAAAYMRGQGSFKTRSGAVGIRKRDIKAIGNQIGFQIKRGSGLKTKEGAFIGNKGRTVFIRTSDKRLPIKAVQVIGFSQMFSSKKISKRIMDKINEELPVEVSRSVMLRMEGRR